MGRSGNRRRRNPSRTAVLGWGLAAALALATLGTASVAIARTHSDPPVERARLQAYADGWGPVFGAQPVDLMAIWKIESAWKPDTVNYSASNILQGGAWGFGQMTVSTANGWAKRLAKHANAAVRGIAARWNGKGQTLVDDPELAAVLSSAMIGSLTREFGSFDRVALAYHNGPGKVRSMIANGEAIPADAPPKGKAYVAMALAAKKAIA